MFDCKKMISTLSSHHLVLVLEPSWIADIKTLLEQNWCINILPLTMLFKRLTSFSSKKKWLTSFDIVHQAWLVKSYSNNGKLPSQLANFYAVIIKFKLGKSLSWTSLGNWTVDFLVQKYIINSFDFFLIIFFLFLEENHKWVWNSRLIPTTSPHQGRGDIASTIWWLVISPSMLNLVGNVFVMTQTRNFFLLYCYYFLPVRKCWLLTVQQRWVLT